MQAPLLGLSRTFNIMNRANARKKFMLFLKKGGVMDLLKQTWQDTSDLYKKRCFLERYSEAWEKVEKFHNVGVGVLNRFRQVLVRQVL